MMRYAVLFPGQGSQHVGMGTELFSEYGDLLGTRADEILGWSLREICEIGPEEDLVRTDRAQPALFAVSYVLWLELRKALGHDPVAAAGHSLGEYTALAAAGVFEFDAALALVAARGAAMERAAVRTPGSMAALIGGGVPEAEKLCEERRASGGALWVANINSPLQVVVAGGPADIDWVVQNARDLGIRRAIPLNVAGAFHSPLMASAVEELEVALQATPLRSPRFPVWANASAEPVSNVAASLRDQLAARVLFADSLVAMAGMGLDAFVHVGPGNVTAGMAARTVEEVETHVVSSAGEIPSVVEALSVQ